MSNHANSIKAVLLDLDETILLDDAATDAAFAATARFAADRAGIDPDELVAAVLRESAALWQAGPHPEWCHGIGTSEVEGLRARFEGEHPNWVDMRAWGPEFRFQSWRRALGACGITNDDLARELDARFDAERAATNPYIADAEAAMRELSEHYKLAMVTNGISDVQRTKVERSGLDKLFDVMVISGELGFGKPDPRIYEQTLTQLGVSASEAIMIGDNFRRDVAGAQDVGIRGVWISIGRPFPDPSVTPWLTIKSLAELPQVLEKERIA